MRRPALAAALLLAACDSAPQPVTAGPRLQAEKAAAFREAEAPGREAAFSRDGRMLATSSVSGLVALRRMPDPDSRWLANAGRARGGLATLWRQLTGAGAYSEAVRLWRVADGALVQALKMPEDVMYVAFSPDGRWLVASGDDGRVTLWRLSAGTG